MNEQALQWCTGSASHRPWPQDRSISVEAAYQNERERLLPLPCEPYCTDEKTTATVGKTPYLRFDLNDYSVPHRFARHQLQVVASLEKVRILNETEVVAEHVRCYDRGQQIECVEHIDELEKRKLRAHQHRGRNRLTACVPNAELLLERAAERGDNLGSLTAALLKLLQNHGAVALEEAIDTSLASENPSVRSLRFLLEKQARLDGQKPRLPVVLPQDPRLEQLSVKPHALASYDLVSSMEEAHHE